MSSFIYFLKSFIVINEFVFVLFGFRATVSTSHAATTPGRDMKFLAGLLATFALAATPFLNFWSMIQVSPQLIRLQSYRSVYSIISKFVKDDHLRQVFSFHPLLVGGNPYTSSSIYTLIHYLERNWGVFFVKGGTGALVTARRVPVVWRHRRP